MMYEGEMLPEEELELDYESAGEGAVAMLERQDEVGPMELEDLLGPEVGHGDDALPPAPLGSLEEPPAMGLGAARDMALDMDPARGLEEDRTFEDEAAQMDARDMLTLRAQERLAASKEFQERAKSLGGQVFRRR